MIFYILLNLFNNLTIKMNHHNIFDNLFKILKNINYIISIE